MSSDAAELLEILTRFETDRLCYAYDRIVAESNKIATTTTTAVATTNIGCNMATAPHDLHG